MAISTLDAVLPPRSLPKNVGENAKTQKLRPMQQRAQKATARGIPKTPAHAVCAVRKKKEKQRQKATNTVQC